MGQNPDPGVAAMTYYPSDAFLEGSERHMLSRYCNFLLQSILLLARVFQVPPIIENTYGAGLRTSARISLLFARSTEMKNKDALNLKKLSRHLYARILQESESRDAITKALGDEWNHDRDAAIASRVDEWLPGHLEEQLGEGRYPVTNLAYDVDKQWDHVWKDSCGRCSEHLLRCLTLFDFKMTSTILFFVY